MNLCPCGSGKALAKCCGRYLDGEAAPTCEALMRSRYSAYVLENRDYLRQTWHPDTCPEHLGGTALKWIALEIVDTEQGRKDDSEGKVSFIASFCDGSKGRRLHETSRFVRFEGRWVYLDGDCRVIDIGRNDPCPCGSGKKFKKCCGSPLKG
ncbi:MAG: YchJ family metal-binding protein [Mariprofundaceae bacterium]|nr:YchJ family metal-binding protein [Mariprofundaceae bacterium]